MSETESIKRNFIANFFGGLDKISSFVGEVLLAALGGILFSLLATALLIFIWLPFYGIVGFFTDSFVKRAAIPIPFVFGTILFIAWIGSRQGKR